VTDRQTDRRTDRQTDGIAMACMHYSIYAVARKNRKVSVDFSQPNSAMAQSITQYYNNVSLKTVQTIFTKTL